MRDLGEMSYSRRDFIRIGAIAVPGAMLMAPAGNADTVVKPSDVLKRIKSAITFLPRSAWASKEPRADRMSESNEYSRLTVHHAGDAVNYATERNSVAYNISGIYTGHLNHKYGDIGYHFIIDYAGRLWEGRSLAYEGAHVSGKNKNNIGVMVLGNFEKQDPSVAQIKTLKSSVLLLCEGFNIKKQEIHGHRDIGSSVCPGTKLYPYVKKLKI